MNSKTVIDSKKNESIADDDEILSTSISRVCCSAGLKTMRRCTTPTTATDETPSSHDSCSRKNNYRETKEELVRCGVIRPMSPSYYEISSVTASSSDKEDIEQETCETLVMMSMSGDRDGMKPPVCDRKKPNPQMRDGADFKTRQYRRDLLMDDQGMFQEHLKRYQAKARMKQNRKMMRASCHDKLALGKLADESTP